MRRANRGAFQRFGRRLRFRLLWSFVAFGAGAAATWRYRDEAFQFLLAPAGDSLTPFGGTPVFTGPVDMMGETIRLAMRGGALAAIPVLVVGAYTLVRPAMPDAQHRFIILFFPATIMCFLGGAAFAYYVMIPTGLGFLLNFGGGTAIPLITLPEYLDLMFALMFGLGMVFELPVAMYLLAKTNIMSYRRMKNLRKFVPVTAFILAAIITPTFDILNQTMVAVPIIALYEVGLFWAWVAHPERGNYLFLKTIWNAILWVGRAIRAVALSPYTVPRWLYRKAARAVRRVCERIKEVRDGKRSD